MALFKQNLFLLYLLLLCRNLSMHFDYSGRYLPICQIVTMQESHISRSASTYCTKFPTVTLQQFLLPLQMCESVNFPVSSGICDKITQKYLLCGNINKHGYQLSELKFLWFFVDQVSCLYVYCPIRCRVLEHRDSALLIATSIVTQSSTHNRRVLSICRKNRWVQIFALILRKLLFVCLFSLIGLQ